MRITFGADDAGVLPVAVEGLLRKLGHDVSVVGPPAGGKQEWAEVGELVGRDVASGAADLGVVACWTGTGVSIAANKVPGVRAALCLDGETARLARRYNHANVLALSMRSSSEEVAREIVTAFLEGVDGDDPFDHRNVARLAGMDGTSAR